MVDNAGVQLPTTILVQLLADAINKRKRPSYKTLKSFTWWVVKVLKFIDMWEELRDGQQTDSQWKRVESTARIITS
jgi:hypothetical protein